MKYDQVAAKIAEHLNVQATHLRFSSATSDGRPRNLPIKRTGPLSTVQQFTTHGGMPLPPIVFYEVLELSLADMESKREVTITWLPDGVATMVPPSPLFPPYVSFVSEVNVVGTSDVTCFKTSDLRRSDPSTRQETYLHSL